MNMSRCAYIDMQETENLGKSSTIEKQFLHFMTNKRDNFRAGAASFAAHAYKVQTNEIASFDYCLRASAKFKILSNISLACSISG